MRGCPRIQPLRGSKQLVTITPYLWTRRICSSHNLERVQVKCGSAGHVTIDLHNVANHSPQSALFIHLPPFPSADSTTSSLPKFLSDRPVASINYRWVSDSREDSGNSGLELASSKWPTPIHDTLFAYSWLVEHLTPEGLQRRDIYVYGSHLGGSLATSLSLTEAHPHMPFAVRGVISYNGVYNWTMFLPDHPVNRSPKRVKNPMPAPRQVEGSHLYHLEEMLRACFRAPVDMFDPFVSPSLLFHNPGLLVPESYVLSSEETAALEALVDPDSVAERPVPKTPRKSHLIFPPRTSTLRIPEALFLYDSPAVARSKSGRKKAATGRGNTMENQALELVELMRRSLEKVELKERGKWDDDVGLWEDEAERRVQTCEIGDERESLKLNDLGEQVIADWLDERI
ncbi:hypothetical protein BGZ63DRAFT_406577 [Mariannaea sp. PMI_226]|nr:hypothetical protein BGZ63DRAFT_406577 [Mariannaea sp. PMI_226]